MKLFIKIKRNQAKLFWIFNRLLRRQRKDIYNIPILIVNFNQLAYMRILIQRLLSLGYQNIIVIDNKSTYPPLLEYYRSMKDKIKVEYMEENFGHEVFFKSPRLQEKYAKGYYALTDPDIVLNDQLPKDFMARLLKLLDSHYRKINKVGFALDIEDIPDYFPLKTKVVKWEKQFWEHPLSKDTYKAYIDTTFALYRPAFLQEAFPTSFYEGIRVAGNYTAKHMGWYMDLNNLTEEQIYYQRTSNSSASWKLSKNGQLLEDNPNYR